MAACKTPEEIDALLPQTQCGLCGFGGCLPYAEALADGKAAINLCPPGGVTTLYALAEALAADATPYVADMAAKAKAANIAVIEEDKCIGCTKCIRACPVDAISGAAKLMHTVIQSDCTGCELCVPVCPMDCIAIEAAPATPTLAQRDYYRLRHQQHNQRVQQSKEENLSALRAKNRPKLQAYIAAALARYQAKKK